MKIAVFFALVAWTTANAQLPELELVDPAKHDTVAPGEHMFRYIEIPEARGYWIQIQSLSQDTTTEFDAVAPPRVSAVPHTLMGGRKYRWRGCAVDGRGNGTFGAWWEFVTTKTTGIVLVETPEHFRLDQNYPNPFNPSTTIGFELTIGGPVSLAVYDVLGRRVATLVDERLAAGKYEAMWNPSTSSGQALASGTYFCRLTAESFVQTRKIVLAR